MNRIIGTVESYHHNKGFGVIRPDGVEEDVSFFAHWTKIFTSAEWPGLHKGMKVEFTPSTNEKGYESAENISLPGGGQINKAELNAAEAADQLGQHSDLRQQVPNQQGHLFNMLDQTLPVLNTMVPQVQAPPANRILSDFTVVGEVVDFQDDMGCGFIVCAVDLPWPLEFPAGSQLFVAREDLVVAEGSPASLVPGLEVEFRVFMDETKGVRAACVHGVGGVPLSLRGVSTGTSAKGSGSGWDASPAGGAGAGVRKTIEKPRGPGSVQASLKESIARMMSGQEIATPGVLPSGPLPSAQNESANGGGSAPFGPPGSEGWMPGAAQASPAPFGPPGSEGWTPQGTSSAAAEQQETWWKKEQPSGWDAPPAVLEPGLGGPLAHAVAQLEQAAAEAKWKKGAGVPAGPKVKQVPCKFFAEGRCNKGFSCEFSHDPEMYRPKSLAEKSASPCSFYDRGMCTRGDACPFAHGIQELLAIKEMKSAGKAAAKAAGKGFKGAPAFNGKGFGATFVAPESLGGAQWLDEQPFALGEQPFALGTTQGFGMPANEDEMDPLELLVQQQNLHSEGLGR